LDGTATSNFGHFTTGPGVAIDRTFATVPGETYFLSFYVNTEVTPLPLPANNLKGSPAGIILSRNGVQIDSGLTRGDFLSLGQPPVFSGPSIPDDTDWTKYTVKFVGSGSDTIKFEDDISLLSQIAGLTNGTFSSNTVIANVTLVPETGEILAIVLGAAFLGSAILRKGFALP
jgi:hypothetical protein